MEDTFTLKNMLMLYYNEDEYQEMRDIAEDKQSLPSSWEEWMKGYRKEGTELAKHYFTIKPVIFILDEFKQTGLPSTHNNRYSFALSRKYSP